MRYLGLDLGTKTLGTSLSDITGTIATTYKLIKFEEEQYDKILPIIKEIVEIEKVDELVLGLPKNMNNSLGESAKRTLEFKEKLEKFLNKKVNLIDERLSTVEANHYMLEGNLSRKKRKNYVDKLAANIILQTYLDKRRK